MNSNTQRQLRKPMGRREMISTTLKAAAAGFAGASVLLGGGCAGTEKHQIATGRNARPVKKEEIEHGLLALPRKELKHYVINDLETQEENCLVKELEDVGKPAVITFWQWHCQPCIAEMEDFEALHRKNPGIQVIGIHSLDMEEDIGEQVELARKIVARVRVTFPQFTTGGGNAYDIAVNVLGQESCPMPVNLIVDTWQRIAYKTRYIGPDGMYPEGSPAHHEFMRVLSDVAGESLGPGPNRHEKKEEKAQGEPAQEKQVEEEPEPEEREEEAQPTRKERKRHKKKRRERAADDNPY
ncbi:MAG: TlpA family protein disulfide reductase [bacterium]|nr:TlpA family protein disulfide reductase [bacterium]